MERRKVRGNLATFNNLASKTSEEEAALKTFTGKIANKLGFNEVDIENKTINEDGKYTSVDVIFKKTK